jgi:hypothetical protein
VLDEEARRDDVVAGDDDARVGSVARPPDAAAVVCAPRPDVVEDRVVAIDDEARRGLTEVRAADAEENVLERAGIGRVARACPCSARPSGSPNTSSAGDVLAPASKMRPEISTPGTSATVIGTAPFSAVSVAIPSPSTIVSGRFTLIVLSTS